MKKIVSLFLFVVSGIFICGCDNNSLQKEIKKVSKNLTNYIMYLEYNDNHTLTGSQTIDYINSSDINFDNIYLHLYPNAFSKDSATPPVSSLNKEKAYPNGFSEGHITINSLSVDGEEKDVNLSGNSFDILDVAVDNLAPNDRVEIKLEYEITIPNCLHRFGYGDNTINIANFYPIVAVYDGEWNLDSYHSNGDPFYSDMANYRVELKTPNNMVVATTGNVKNKTENDNVNVYNIEAYSVRDFACVLSDKFNVVSEKYDNVTISYYYYNDDNYEQSLKTAVDSIKTFNNLYGKYPYDTYSVVKANFIHGGMEYPNLVIISDSVNDYNDYVNVIVHETAHQWWYGLVGNNEYDHAWMDEGLTDYSTALFYKYNPEYGIKYDEIIKNTTNSYVNFVEVYTKVLGSVDTTMNRSLNEYNTEPEYVYMAYVKGTLLFDSLCENVGEEKFLKILKKYFNDYKYKNASPECLIGTFEKYLGCDMVKFFNSWIDGKVIIKRVG